ncbi:MAG: hypothetical protein BGO70_08400 [Bacteroidetes bacterium 43-93]|nr:hypothetical protein [Bacteroidota bacterium]OJW97785.1 MAG: hypothetical protein BGO70_08400 [Bacteroidetes bacterium 43-93]
MQATIDHWVHIDEQRIIKDGSPLLSFNADNETAASVYRNMGYSYPKFFKMDLLCQWAWLGAEVLLAQDGGTLYEGIDKTKVGVVLATGKGCLDADKKYLESTATIASPSLFVYTLPNIMLGEICIRHGFKGEQICFVNDEADAEQIYFWVNDLLQNRGMEACLCGWADAVGNERKIKFYWVTKAGKGPAFTPEHIDIINKG